MTCADDCARGLSVPILRRATIHDHDALVPIHARSQAYLARLSPDISADVPLEEDWFTKPEILRAYVIEGDGRRAIGYALVTGAAYARAVGAETDWLFHALEVEPAARGTGAAEMAVRAILAECRGTWTVAVLPGNEPAVRFWRRVLASVDPDVAEGTLLDGLPTLRFRA